MAKAKPIIPLKVLNPPQKMKCYRNNSNIKATGVKLQYTKEQVEEYMKCKEDPVYFVENYVKVVHVDRGLVPFIPYDYQVEFIRAMHENRKVLLATARQVGKCFCYKSMVCIKHENFNEGIPFEIMIGDFYTWQAFVRWFKENIECLVVV